MQERCPICNSVKYRYVYYTEECWGIVEQHGYCSQCGFTIEQCYSDTITDFTPAIRKGSTGYKNQYISKNIRKRKRYKRKFKIKYGNKDWQLSYLQIDKENRE